MWIKDQLARFTPQGLKDLRRFLSWSSAGNRFAKSFSAADAGQDGQAARAPGPLEAYFDANREGPGIWKWRHYFDVYHRHFARFVGRPVNVLEIGVFSGGSLPMWRQYFGPRSSIYGVDIEPACTAYEGERIKVFIGDQSDPEFWKRFKAEVPELDVVIDDGGHLPHQQATTLEHLLPHLRPGGVFLCEDVVNANNAFASYCVGLMRNLHHFPYQNNYNDPERRVVVPAGPFQAAVHSIHVYPYVFVIERNDHPVREFLSPKRGTQWEPFLP
jgi:SAM-dependent methyltransferase